MRGLFRRRSRHVAPPRQERTPARPTPAEAPEGATIRDRSARPTAAPAPDAERATPIRQDWQTPKKRTPIRPQRGVATWVPPGSLFEVGGREIPDGMVYIGSRALSADRRIVEPSLIDRSLRVGWRRPDWSGSTMGYWPSYDTGMPEARGAYLNWLLYGRRNPSAYIGYVFLFFYGIERRILVDLAKDLSHSEVDVLVAEVNRLLDIYGNNRSFRGYATSFLDLIASLKSLEGELAPVPWNPDDRGWELPNALRLGLGRLAAAGTPLPADWALSYLRHHPENGLRTAAQRCQPQFDELFCTRYHQRFPGGIKMRAPARKIDFSYYPASAGFGGTVSVESDVPDITSVVGPLNKLKDLGAECADELDALSRFLGRRPDESASASAVSLLPDVLLATHGGPVVQNLQAWTSSAIANAPYAAVPLSTLVQQWSPGREDKLTKREAASLASLLAKIGVGLEPDVRFGASTPKPDSTAVLFTLSEGASAAPSSAYTAAVSLVHLAALVAAADGTISSSEQHHLAQHIEQVLGLDASERARLEAHFVLLTSSKPGMAGLKRKVETLSHGERVAIGSFLIDIAAADGVVSPDEISTITKIFGLLELDEGDVYSQVHALGVGDSGPVTARQAAPAPRWEIPSPGDIAQPDVVRLDPAKVQARLAETAHVAALLTDIFAEDDVAPASSDAGGSIDSRTPTGPQASAPAAASTIDGLDVPHSALATALVHETEWHRFAAEDLASSLGLPLLDGALDIINEAAMDICGEPLIEGDDPLELNPYAIEALL